MGRELGRHGATLAVFGGLGCAATPVGIPACGYPRTLPHTVPLTPFSLTRNRNRKGLDYVVAHLIKCLGTDAHVGFGSDPERVFKVILGLFRDYGLEHIYSENLEVHTALRFLEVGSSRRGCRRHACMTDEAFEACRVGSSGFFGGVEKKTSGDKAPRLCEAAAGSLLRLGSFCVLFRGHLQLIAPARSRLWEGRCGSDCVRKSRPRTHGRGCSVANPTVPPPQIAPSRPDS